MRVRALLVGGLCALLLACAIPASADEGYDIVLPPALDVVGVAEVPFTVSALGGICSVRALGAGTVTGSGPYLLTIDPAAFDATSLTQPVTVVATSCDGTEFYEQIQVRLPYAVSISRIVAPWSEVRAERALNVAVLATSATPITVSVLRNGSVFRDLGVFSDAADITVSVPKSKAAGDWEVRIQQPAGDRRQAFTVARQWAVLVDDGQRLARFPACSTVTWSYNSDGRPKFVADPKADITGALRRLSAATGLTFREVKADADLEYAWADLGDGPVAAAGGGSWTDAGYQASVTMNSRSSWLKHPGFGRVAQRGGLPARGYVFLHETGHALGLGHVQDKSQVMNSYAYPGSPLTLGKGDRGGLDYLYRPKSCRKN